METDTESGNGHGKWKRTRKMENLSREMLVFIKKSSTSTKDKEQTSCIKRIGSIKN